MKISVVSFKLLQRLALSSVEKKYKYKDGGDLTPYKSAKYISFFYMHVEEITFYRCSNFIEFRLVVWPKSWVKNPNFILSCLFSTIFLPKTTEQISSDSDP